jgi:hypothetical protein
MRLCYKSLSNLSSFLNGHLNLGRTAVVSLLRRTFTAISNESEPSFGRPSRKISNNAGSIQCIGETRVVFKIPAFMSTIPV